MSYLPGGVIPRRGRADHRRRYRRARWDHRAGWPRDPRAAVTASPSGSPVPQLVVELLGEFPGGPVGDRPQRANERSRPGLHEGFRPAVQPVVRRGQAGRPARVEEDERRGREQAVVDARRLHVGDCEGPAAQADRGSARGRVAVMAGEVQQAEPTLVDQRRNGVNSDSTASRDRLARTSLRSPAISSPAASG